MTPNRYGLKYRSPLALLIFLVFNAVALMLMTAEMLVIVESRMPAAESDAKMANGTVEEYFGREMAVGLLIANKGN